MAICERCIMKKRVLMGICGILTGCGLFLGGLGMTAYDCWLCGKSQSGLKAICKEMDSLGILRMNLWEVTELNMTEKGELEQNQMYVSVRGEEYGMLLVMPEPDSCRFQLDLRSGEVLDMELAKERFCKKCYRQIEELREKYGNQMWDVFWVEPLTAQVFFVNAQENRQVGAWHVTVTEEEKQMKGMIWREK